MNILYLHTHDSGRYLSPYGWPAPTPNLQRLAEEGTVFRNAFCTAPTCSPSRAGMLSGIDLETTAFQLEDGDMVVMATDGVLDGMEGEDKEESFRGLLASCSAQNPKELAEQLLSSALRDRDARDDMTVLTAGIWKK